MFLYGIGILYGRQFFEGLTGPGRSYNLLALVAVVAGLMVALGLGSLFHVKLGHTLGIFAGSMTSTATLQAALDVMGNREPSIGYSVAYPFGVIGPILCFYFLTRRVKPSFPEKPARFHMGEVTIERLPAGGTMLGDVMAILPEGAQVASVRQESRNRLPAPRSNSTLAMPCSSRPIVPPRLPKWPRPLAAWSPDESPRIALIFRISAFSFPRRI